MKMAVAHPDGPAFLSALNERILHARISAARAVNGELVMLSWNIARRIVEKQRTLGWGKSVIDQLSSDLRDAFSRRTAFSSRNLRDMKRFHLAYSDESIWPQPVAKSDGNTAVTDILRQLAAEISWGHHPRTMNNLTNPAKREKTQ